MGKVCRAAAGKTVRAGGAAARALSLMVLKRNLNLA
jgi:hypothetical protein